LVEVRCADLGSAVAEGERFPLVLADPPYVPSGEAGDFPDDPEVAIDGGSGIRAVQLSGDAATTWSNAMLEADNGPYSFRRWHSYVTLQPGTQTLACRAQAGDGSLQVATPIWNGSGYQRSSIETYKVSVT